MRPHAPDFLFILKDTYLREAADGPGVRWRSPVRRFTNICAFLVAQSRCGCQQRLWISMIHMKIGKKKKNPTTYRVEIWICSAFNQLYYFRKLTCFNVWQTNWEPSPRTRRLWPSSQLRHTFRMRVICNYKGEGDILDLYIWKNRYSSQSCDVALCVYLI